MWIKAHSPMFIRIIGARGSGGKGVIDAKLTSIFSVKDDEDRRNIGRLRS